MSDHTTALGLTGSPKSSVIVPTHNRGTSLTLTLDSLLRQNLPPTEFEIIVVDNASSDDTPVVLQGWLRNEATVLSGIQVKVLREERLGLHYARHAGVRVAQGDILAFTDDDAVVDPHWLEALRTTYDAPDVGCAGGKIVPRWLAEPPAWLLPYAPGNLSLLDLGDVVQSLDSPIIYGCNFSVRRSVLYEVGGFNPDSFGDIWLGDGETGLLLKVLQAGYRIVYTPIAMVEHLIPPHRLTLAYLKLRRANQGACEAYIYYRQYRSRTQHLARLALMRLRQAAGHQVTSWLHRDRLDAAYYHHTLEVAYCASQARYFGRLLWDRRFRAMVLKEGWIYS